MMKRSGEPVLQLSAKRATRLICLAFRECSVNYMNSLVESFRIVSNTTCIGNDIARIKRPGDQDNEPKDTCHVMFIPLPKNADLTDPKYVELAIDFAYGNVRLENPTVTREMVENAISNRNFDHLPKVTDFGF